MTEEEKKLKRLIDTGEFKNVRQAIELGEALGKKDWIRETLAPFVSNFLRKDESVLGVTRNDVSEIAEILVWNKEYGFGITLDLWGDKAMNISQFSRVYRVINQSVSLDRNKLRTNLTKAIKNYLSGAGVPMSVVADVFKGDSKYFLSQIEDQIDGRAEEYLTTKWFEKRL